MYGELSLENKWYTLAFRDFILTLDDVRILHCGRDLIIFIQYTLAPVIKHATLNRVGLSITL